MLETTLRLSLLYQSMFMLRTIPMSGHRTHAGGRPGTWCLFILVLLPLVLLAGVRGARADVSWGEAYGGVFVGAGRTENRIIDPQGFAHWGKRGWATDYDGTDLAGGLLLGREFTLNSARFRVELDGVFGDMSRQTDRVDPQGRDETARASLRWATTARVGVEQTEGPVTVLFNGGVAVAGIENSVTDIDFFPDMPPRKDPDDSFHDRSTRIGWVLGLGIEAPLGDAWRWRLDGSYLGFGRSTHRVNRSGNNPCGPGGPREACRYRVENHLVILRLAIIRRFDL